jgi:hypothetical protein
LKNPTAIAVVNFAPIIGPITNQSIRPATTLAFNVEASDPSPDQLTFSLDPGAPAGAQIDSTNGYFSWFASLAQASSSNSITVRVTQNGFPFLSSTATFVVVVEDYCKTNGGFD